MNLTKLFKTGIILILFNVLCTKLAAQETINTITFTLHTDDVNLWFDATANEEYTIDWGDGTIETKTGGSGDLSLFHIYTIHNEYTVTIAGSTPDCRFTYCSFGTLIGYPISHLTLSGCSDLEILDCNFGKLRELDLSGCPKLTHLTCSNNYLSDLDLSGCPKLMDLKCYNNQIINLDLTGCSELTSLGCSENQVSSLDLSGCPKLTSLICDNNQISSLDLFGCPKLTSLNCSNNQINSLDLSRCPELQKLTCANNQLTRLDLTGCFELQELYCYNNQLPLTELFAAHLLIDNRDRKYLGGQYMPPLTVKTGEELFADQSVINGIFTHYAVMQNGNHVSTNDYTVVDGKLIFNTIGQYTVVMSNDAIVSHPGFYAGVEIEITVEKGTGITNTTQNSIMVYPNPATNEIYVKLNSQQVTNYAIYNIRGQQVKRGRLQEESNINIQSLLKGIYYIKLDDKDNRTISFIKK